MADAKSNYLERKNLDHNLGTTTYTKPSAVYVSLHTASPTDAASGAEVSGGSYARVATAFSAAATDGSGNSTASNSADIDWSNLPNATITHVGIYDASTSGNLLYWGALTGSKTVTSGDNFTINSGSLVVQEQ
jgi:hypothetical protein